MCLACEVGRNEATMLRTVHRYANQQCTAKQREASGMPNTILETKGLTREFSGFVAVNNVSLQVETGMIHALIGPNGAGKTTCFNLLTKFLQPTRGTIQFKEQDITGLKPAQ